MKTFKKCRKCLRELPVEDFVDVSGEINKRGAYCKPCHLERIDEWRKSALAEEASHIPKLQIVYGKWWMHYAIPEDFRHTLIEERDYCPYCHTKFSEVIPNSFNPAHIHLDHMDPLTLGGEHSIRNTVNCCGPCNIKKGNLRFTNWLRKLNPEKQESARQIYIEKHGHLPEEFEEGGPVSKGMWLEMAIYSTEEKLKRIYPEPSVSGPPSNRPLTITINLQPLVEKALAAIAATNKKTC
jgi:hypothetical protein